MNNRITELEAQRIKKNKKIIISIIAVLLALVIITGAVLGVLAIVRNVRAVVRYEGITVDKGMASYMAATFKTRFMAEYKVTSDDPAVWNSPCPGTDMTYGELLRKKCEEYIRGVVIGAYLFDRYYELSGEEKRAIERACEAVLEYKAGADRKTFNKNTEAMGFDYKDMCRAVELIYKAECSKAIIYGEEGASLETDQNRTDECEEYFGQYVRVKVLYIPTKVELKKNEDGKLETDGQGKYVAVELDASEKLAREEEIAEIIDLIEATRVGGDVKMTETYFEMLMKEYNYDQSFVTSGYYFSSSSLYREKFATDSSARLTGEYKEVFYANREWVVSSAFEMNVGEYRMLEDKYGTTFIYKCEKESQAYASIALESMFHDFYSDAADYLYVTMRDILIPEVEVKDKYYKIDVVAIPYNTVYVPKIEL